MNVADRIQHLRKTRGLSQEDLADRIGVSRQAVSKWESEQSQPDMDKIIIMSDYFEVTTDYILKGIESGNQAGKKVEGAGVFVAVASALNFIGLVVACAVWYEEQVAMALVIGLVFMALGMMLFGMGMVFTGQNKVKAKRIFWTINIWFLSFIPLSFVYNALFTDTTAPYPLFSNSLIVFPAFWLVYFVVCLSVVFAQVKKNTKR